MMTETKIINIGGEIVRGEILNSNAQYIADALSGRGLFIEAIITLPDDYEHAVASIAKTADKPGIYIFTGGLGGTGDDLTRTIVSEVLNKKLCIDERGKRVLEQWYKKRGRSLRRADLMQASYPEGGALLENRYGLAYGFRIEDRGRMIFCLPGVPKEMRWMFDNEVLPVLDDAGVFDRKYVSELLTFAGIGEYTLDRRVAAIVSRYDGVRYGTRAGYGITRVVLESRGKEIDPCISEISLKLAKYFISRGGKRLEEVVGTIMLKQGRTLAVAESCTAGYVAKVVTDVPGSSRYFLGGVVAYSNEAKQHLLGVSQETLREQGAVSEETAVEMAEGAIKMFGSEIAISVTGIAGPGGGSPNKPVGTVFICVLEKENRPNVSKYLFSGEREIVRYRSVVNALFMLYTLLRDR
jgi:nicotinamide-nucleotide amidase